MNRKSDRPRGLFTFVQLMSIAAMAVVSIGLIMALAATLTGDLLQTLCLAGAMGCMLWLLAEFVVLCGRVKRETAFTLANVRTMGRIALAFAATGMLFIPSGGAAMAALTADIPGAWHPLMAAFPAFGGFAAALLVRAIQLLLARAVDMQTEQDLTV